MYSGGDFHIAIFGYNVKGGSSIASNTGAYKCLFPLTEAGTVTKLTIRLLNNQTYAKDIDTGIYNGTAKVVNLTISVPGSYDDWIDADIADTVLAAGTYGLAFKCKGIGVIEVYYAAGDTNQTQADTGLSSAANLPDPFDVNLNYALKVSIYATYTPAPPSGNPNSVQIMAHRREPKIEPRRMPRCQPRNLNLPFHVQRL